MTSTFMPQNQDTFDSLYTELKRLPTPLLPPGKAHTPALTDRIASLYVHPTLEALLHILNHDLPSAHFLVRHMQAAPALEGMYIHGLLHRVEGDYDNCRAWYADVCSSPAFVAFWGTGSSSDKSRLAFLDASEREGEVATREGNDSYDGDASGPRMLKTVDGEKKVPSQLAPRLFISAVQRLNDISNSKQSGERREALARVSRDEIEALVSFCAEKFGTGRVEDASKVWVRPGEEVRQMGSDMVSEGQGRRDF